MKYEYQVNMMKDVKQAILDNYTKEEIKKELLTSESRWAFEDKLRDQFWADDSVTGNASGSYTFNAYKAEEYIAHNLDLLREAFDEFGCNYSEALEKGAEYYDVTIRCYLLPSIICYVLDKFYNEFELYKINN